MKVVVVGSRGTLGARLLDELAVDGVDFRSHEREGSWRDVIASADAVVNVGGPRVRPGLTDSDYLREHVGVAEMVADAMKPGTHLVHVSSTAVFGASKTPLAADSKEFPERFPIPEYAIAKLAAERAAKMRANARRLDVTVLRPSMVYGPHVDSALASLLKLAERGVALHLRPRKIRQHLVHIDLLVAAIRAAVVRPQGPRPVILADPFVLTNGDLDCRAKVALPVPLNALASGQRALRNLGAEHIALDSFAVLGVDNQFEVDETFTRLGLSRESFARNRTFDRYFAV